MQCIFNWQEGNIGPSTGGNLRYMLVISPLVAIGAALALEETVLSPKRFAALLYLGVLVVLTALFLNYKSDLLQLLDEDFAQGRILQQYGEDAVRKMSSPELDGLMKQYVKKDAFPLGGVLVAILILLIPMSAQARQSALIVSLALTVLVEVRPIKMSDEDKTMQDLATWFRQNEAQYKGKPMFISHVMLYYFLERTKTDFDPVPQLLTGEKAVQAAPKGTAIFWDSHFSYKPKLNPNALPLEYFTKRPQEFELKNQIVSASENFGVFIFEKR